MFRQSQQEMKHVGLGQELLLLQDLAMKLAFLKRKKKALAQMD
jgi:hypothetical protein